MPAKLKTPGQKLREAYYREHRLISSMHPWSKLTADEKQTWERIAIASALGAPHKSPNSHSSL